MVALAGVITLTLFLAFNFNGKRKIAHFLLSYSVKSSFDARRIAEQKKGLRATLWTEPASVGECRNKTKTNKAKANSFIEYFFLFESMMCVYTIVPFSSFCVCVSQRVVL